MSNSNKTRSDLLHDTQSYSTFYLKAGEVYYSKNPQLVHTILGSCVSIVFYYAPLTLSIICHALLPYKKPYNECCYENCPINCRTYSSNNETNLKYVNCSFKYMLKIIHKFNIPKEKILVKVFGGASVLPLKGNGITVGEGNIKTAFELIEEHNLNLISSCVGGNKGRTLYLYTETGDVYLSHLSRDINFVYETSKKSIEPI